ncbi:phosphotransferase enzyme family protein [Sporosarcina sp. YIM B06819]|uniref:phosphotransferase enzyme family protein n=1 Tax=Sporosarcina sp. YIM B06819 TaxID=3081769 RepID=UPI00298D0CB6|nr:phosphotransferase [Sporosarcina sp. YIM B06819]
MTVIKPIIEESTLVTILSDIYCLTEPISCKFLRRSFNDHYSIKSGTKQFILRVYINNKNYIRSINDFRFELDFLEYLFINKLPVIPPIKSINNQNLCKFNLNQETVYIALFSFAKGTAIDINLNKDQATNFGEIIAKLHLSSKNFKSKYSRYCLDVQSLIEEPLQLIGKYAYSFGLGNLSFFDNHSKKLIDRINDLPINNETFGIVHGDPNPSNYHFSNENGFSLFDFDHCAYGYRIHDLAVIRLCFPEKVYDAILGGYELIRPLQDIERDCLEVYTDFLLIRKFGDILNMLELTDNDESKKQLVTQNALCLLKNMIET